MVGFQAIGFSHITFTVSNLEASLRFYVDTLGMTVVRRTEQYASLTWGQAEISLSETSALPVARKQVGYDHVAFSVSPTDFWRGVEHLRNSGVALVGALVRRGAGWSLNFLDPDGIELEIHTPTE